MLKKFLSLQFKEELSNYTSDVVRKKVNSLSANLTTIAGPWYFGRVLVPQRLIKLSLYHEILLLQKFNDTGGKVSKPKKSASNLRKK